MDTLAPSKTAPWSYSRLKNFEVCPRRYHELDVLKNWQEGEKSEQLAYGDAIHKEMAQALQTGRELHPAHSVYQHWVDKLNRTPGQLLVECKWAITRDFTPTAWMSPKVWLRSIADAVKIDGEVALVIDWKTGKSANSDPVQLELTALVMFIHYPKLQMIRTDFIWLQEDNATPQVFERKEAVDRWAEIMPRVKSLELATATQNFPPQPNHFCHRWCSVESCEYHGKKF